MKHALRSNHFIWWIVMALSCYGGHASAGDGGNLDGEWAFLPGSEFPGARGEWLADQPSVKRFKYDLGCGVGKPDLPGAQACGRYVAARLKLKKTNLPEENRLPAIRLKLRTPDGVAQMALRVLDSSGQTMQHKMAARTLENPYGQQYQQVQVDIGRSQLYWGSAASGILHPPVKEVSVLVGDMPLRWPSAEVQFADLQYVADGTVAYALKNELNWVPGKWPSSYVGRLLVAAHRPQATQLDQLKSVGVQAIRVDMFWQAVERQGKYDFTRYDKIAGMLRERGMSALWILDYGHPDYGDGPPVDARARAAYAKFAQAAARRYADSVSFGFEIWNEENLAHYWRQPDPVAYGALLKEAARAIHGVKPGLRVVSGGLANTDQAYLLGLARSGALSEVDAVGIHPYRKDAPEHFAGVLGALSGILRAHQVSAPLVDTEWGYASAGDFPAAEFGDGHDARAQNRQAILTVRKVLTQVALNLEFSTIYALSDEGQNPLDREHNFGLLGADGREKPGFVALKQLYAAQSGRKLLGLLADLPPGLHAMGWEGGDGQVLAIWSDAPGRPYRIQLPSRATMALDWRGNKLNADGAAPAVLNLQEAQGPVYVHLRPR
jgi:hypothetical protein